MEQGKSNASVLKQEHKVEEGFEMNALFNN